MSDSSLWVRNLVSDWNHCHGAFYRLREGDLHWHLREQDWLSYFPLEIAGVPALCAEASEKGASQGISRKTLWLSCQGRIPPGREQAFADSLDRLAPSRGKSRLCLGGEEFHLIPGIPLPPDDGGLNAVAEGLGFTFADAVDYTGSLRSKDLLAYVSEAKAAAGELRLETVAGEAGLDELGAYLKREFAGRWEREFRFWREHGGTKRAFWNVLRRGKEPCGFSRLAVRGSAEGGWLPGALRFPLSEGNGSVDFASDAALGPIGVSSSERGRGAGKVLLGLSLQLLLDKNAERLCIDWTNAYNYYKPLGLQLVRKYRSALKDY
jgi:hypothetical protein